MMALTILLKLVDYTVTREELIIATALEFTATEKIVVSSLEEFFDINRQAFFPKFNSFLPKEKTAETITAYDMIDMIFECYVYNFYDD